MAASASPPDPNYMLSLARGLEVLRSFASQPSLTIAEAERISGLNRPSTSRCLHTLTRLGYVRECGGRYALTPALLPLAAGYLTSSPLAAASQAIANALRDRLGETASVAALEPCDPGRIIYIARAERNQIIAAPLMIGSTLPSHCTSMGRILIAAMPDAEREAWLAGARLETRTPRTIVAHDELRLELRQVVEQRWSLVEEELEPGLRSLAVPVRDREGETVAALNIATFSQAYSREYLLETCLPDLRAAAGQLERAI